MRITRSRVATNYWYNINSIPLYLFIYLLTYLLTYLLCVKTGFDNYDSYDHCNHDYIIAANSWR